MVDPLEPVELPGSIYLKRTHRERIRFPSRAVFTNMQSLKGHLLIATPQLNSPLFARSVILMLEHNDQGAMGVIVNQPINTMITDLAGKIFEEDFEWNKPLHLGGPVPGSLIILHAREDLGDYEIIPGVFVTLEAIGRAGDHPRPHRAVAGDRQLLRLGGPASSRVSSTGIPGSPCPRVPNRLLDG